MLWYALVNLFGLGWLLMSWTTTIICGRNHQSSHQIRQQSSINAVDPQNKLKKINFADGLRGSKSHRTTSNNTKQRQHRHERQKQQYKQQYKQHQILAVNCQQIHEH